MLCLHNLKIFCVGTIGLSINKPVHNSRKSIKEWNVKFNKNFSPTQIHYCQVAYPTSMRSITVLYSHR